MVEPIPFPRAREAVPSVPAASPGMIRTTITYLEMTEKPSRAFRPPPPEKSALLRAERCTTSYYRYLYDTVGGPWLWWFRRAMPEQELAAIIGDERVEIFVLYVGGVPAGYAEIDRRVAGTANLAYFGLVPDFIGRGLGPWLLDWAVDAAWAGAGTTRVTVNTCTLDHPKALLMYQRAGFKPVRQEEKEEPDPRLAGFLPRGTAPHVPLVDP